MKWQRPLTKPKATSTATATTATVPVMQVTSNGVPGAGRGLAAKKPVLSPVPPGSKVVRGVGSSYTRMGHSYSLVRAPPPPPSQLPPGKKQITSPLFSSSPAPSVPPPAAPVLALASDASRKVESRRVTVAPLQLPLAAGKYSRKKANQLVRRGSTPKKTGPPSTSLQTVTAPVEAQTSKGTKSIVVVAGGEKALTPLKLRAPVSHGGCLLLLPPLMSACSEDDVSLIFTCYPHLLTQVPQRRQCCGRWRGCGGNIPPPPLHYPTQPQSHHPKLAALCCDSREEGAKRSSLWQEGQGGLFCEWSMPSRHGLWQALHGCSDSQFSHYHHPQILDHANEFTAMKT